MQKSRELPWFPPWSPGGPARGRGRVGRRERPVGTRTLRPAFQRRRRSRAACRRCGRRLLSSRLRGRSSFRFGEEWQDAPDTCLGRGLRRQGCLGSLGDPDAPGQGAQVGGSRVPATASAASASRAATVPPGPRGSGRDVGRGRGVVPAPCRVDSGLTGTVSAL